MFRKMTQFDHHKSFMPFDYLFMTKEQYQEFINKTNPPDVPITIDIKTPDDKPVEKVEGIEESKD